MVIPRTEEQDTIRVIDKTGRISESKANPCPYVIILTPEAFDKLLVCND